MRSPASLAALPFLASVYLESRRFDPRFDGVFAAYIGASAARKLRRLLRLPEREA